MALEMIISNDSGVDKVYVPGGVTVLASTTYTVPENLQYMYACSQFLHQEFGAALASVQDGAGNIFVGQEAEEYVRQFANTERVKMVVTETFTSAGNGSIVDCTLTPMSRFALSARSTGVVVSWNVVLEGSLDGTNFTTILTQTNLIGNGIIVFSGSSMSPCLYFRVRCTAIVLGLGTNITVTGLALP